MALYPNEATLVGCFGKTIYPNAAAAWVAVRRQRTRSHGAYTSVPYRCRFANHWHLGDDLPRLKRRYRDTRQRATLDAVYDEESDAMTQ